jgi:hypothetical protein
MEEQMNILKNRLFLIAIGLIVVLALGFFGYRHFHNNSAKRSAVFMTNGQVYFGYLKSAGDKTLMLNDVYYLRTQDLQNGTNSKILLVKMGNELHGPESNMTISRDQVLFWQTLRSESKINDAIARFNQGGAATPAPTSTLTPTPSPSI